MKPYTTVQLNVKVPDTTADSIKRLAAFNQITVAEQLRRFIEEGLAVSTYGTNNAALKLDKPCAWSSTSVSHILEHEEYIGTTVNCRSYIPSFKSKKSRDNPSEKWLRFENTHEPLIDRKHGTLFRECDRANADLIRWASKICFPVWWNAKFAEQSITYAAAEAGMRNSTPTPVANTISTRTSVLPALLGSWHCTRLYWQKSNG